jgi:hypothetical protein
MPQLPSLDYSRARYQPFAHQREDTQTLVQHPWYWITSEMRTGKTKIVIDAAQFLFTWDKLDRMLVVAPPEVRDVWFDDEIGEIIKHAWDGLPIRVEEFQSKRKLWSRNVDLKDPKQRRLDIVVTNYEFIARKMRLKQLIAFCGARTMLVGDESHYLQNWKAQRTKSFKELRRRCGRVVLMTGTPGEPEAFFSQGNILHPSILECPYISYYRARYAKMAPVMRLGGDIMKVKQRRGGKDVEVTLEKVEEWINMDDIQRRFAPYTVRRLQKDCLDMVPEKLDPVTLTATLSDEEWKRYKEMRDDCVILFEKASSVVEANQAIVKTVRLAQITSGFVGGVKDLDLSDEDRPSWLALPDPQAAAAVDGIFEIGRSKLDVVLWFLNNAFQEDKNLKIVVWCRFRPELFRMVREVRKVFPQFQIGQLFGGQKDSDRLAAKKLLHPTTAPEGPVFLGATYGTGSVGLNFTAAHRSINCSYDYSLIKYLQGGDRIYGPEQTHPAGYWDIVARGPNGQKTIDHKIITARRNKVDIMNWTISAWVKALQDE